MWSCRSGMGHTARNWRAHTMYHDYIGSFLYFKCFPSSCFLVTQTSFLFSWSLSHIYEQPPSKVKLSNILYKNIKGTSFTKLAINLLCSSGNPCENIKMSDIDLAYQDPEMSAAAFCSNAKVSASGKLNPPPCK